MPPAARLRDPVELLLNDDVLPVGFVRAGVDVQPSLPFAGSRAIRRIYSRPDPDRELPADTELMIQVTVANSVTSAEQLFEGIRAVFDLLNITVVPVDVALSDKLLVGRKVSEQDDGRTTEEIFIDVRVGQLIGSVRWEDDAGYADLDTAIEIALLLEARLRELGPLR